MYMTQSRHNHAIVMFCEFNYKFGESAGNFRKNSRTVWGYFMDTVLLSSVFLT